MTTNSLRARLVILSAGLMLASAIAALAEGYQDTNLKSGLASRYQSTLTGTPKLELPAKAAAIVQSAKPEQKEATGIAVLRVVSKINPASVPPTVGAIARVEPKLTAALAKEAEALQPKLASEIRLAASSGTTVNEPKTEALTTFIPPTPTGGDGQPKKKGHYKFP